MVELELDPLGRLEPQEGRLPEECPTGGMNMVGIPIFGMFIVVLLTSLWANE
jgi:hypothetical protein